MNVICTLVFLLESILLIIALGPRGYFTSATNTWNLAVTLATVFEMLIALGVFQIKLGFNPAAFRVARMTRMLYLLQKFPGLVQIARAIAFALPALYNVG